MIGEPQAYVSRSATGRQNRALRGAWASYYADRAMLLVTVAWLGLRYLEWQRIMHRPDGIYEARMWLGEFIFPNLPSSVVFYVLLAAALVLTIGCFFKPRVTTSRVLLAVSLLVVSAPGQGFGHIEHTGHLLLLAHVYSMFRPAGQPTDLDGAACRNRGYTWFLLGLLAVYTASGLWKIVDMTIRDVVKPGVTWLSTEAMLSTSIASMRGVDLGMAVPHVVDRLAWAFPIGYVLLTLIFAASFIGAFRRTFLLVVVPTIAAFHLLNAVVMYVLFIVTIFVAVAVLAPYEILIPGIRSRLIPIARTHFEGSGHDARFVIRYANDETDRFHGFYAYRERLRHRSALLSAPLYYPGLGWAASRLLRAVRRTDLYDTAETNADH